MTDYTFVWKNSQQLYTIFGNFEGFARYPDIPFNKAQNVLQVAHGTLMTCYVGHSDLERYVEEGKLFLDREVARTYIRKANEQCIAHKKFFALLSTRNLAEARNEELLTYWEGIIDNFAHSISYFRSTAEQPSRMIVEKVVATLAPEDMESMLLSAELDEINKEEVGWETIVSSGFTEEKAREHIQKFPWLFQNALSIAETVKELQQRLEGHVSRDIVKEKAELASKQKETMSRYSALADEIATLHELAVLRAEIKGCWGATGYYALPLLRAAAKRFTIDLHTLVFFYRSEDISELLRSGKVLNEEEVAARKLCTAYFLHDQTLEKFVGNEAEEVERRELQKRDRGEVTELKGASARKGVVRGRVRILKINDPESTREFRETFNGEVLVTSMTQPNVVDIARRASAIVTDEGGMLCHAAIISREFGIPCIVGTHTATTDLKNGDMVEVDADTGVVRILK